jgi:hypothetical protein
LRSEICDLRVETLMTPVNLIPARRLIARERQRHARRCIVICSSWALVMAGVCVLGRGMVPVTADAFVSGSGDGNGVATSLPARLERAAKDVEAGQQTVAAAREELAAAQATLRATRSIANQPDWSTLLALIGRTTGDDVILRTFELQPQGQAGPGSSGTSSPKPNGRPATAAPGAGAAAASTPTEGFVLNVSGLARSQFGVTQFVLRLERVGLFSKVALLDTSREPFHDADATSFRIECVIDATHAAPANATTTATPSASNKAQRGKPR